MNSFMYGQKYLFSMIKNIYPQKKTVQKINWSSLILRKHWQYTCKHMHTCRTRVRFIRWTTGDQ